MSEGWPGLQGQVVDGQFLLQRYLGSSDHSGVFLTEAAKLVPPDVALKLVSVAATHVEPQLARWHQAAEVAHPHLMRLFGAGKCDIGALGNVYVVMEYADQDLAQLLQHRALTEDETREMLVPVLSALAFLHERRLTLGHVKPSNILVVGDQLKLATDGIRPDGEVADFKAICAYDPPEARDGSRSAAADVWALGVTLCEALTRHQPLGLLGGAGTVVLPPDLPPAFREMVAWCLRRRPEDRPEVAEIDAWLSGQRTVPELVPVAAPEEVELILEAPELPTAMPPGAAHPPAPLTSARPDVAAPALVDSELAAGLESPRAAAPKATPSAQTLAPASKAAHPSPVAAPPAQAPSVSGMPSRSQAQTPLSQAPPALSQPPPPPPRSQAPPPSRSPAQTPSRSQPPPSLAQAPLAPPMNAPASKAVSRPPAVAPPPKRTAQSGLAAPKRTSAVSSSGAPQTAAAGPASLAAASSATPTREARSPRTRATDAESGEPTRPPVALMVLALIAAVAMIWGGIHAFRRNADPSIAPVAAAAKGNGAAASVAEPAAQAEPATRASVPAPAARPSRAAPIARSTPAGPRGTDLDSSTVHEVIPDVPERARRTIRGHVRVSVRVIVDADGSVFAALAEQRGPSRYFERLALDAAKQWSFAPADGSAQRLVLVKFSFGREGTSAQAVPLK